MSGDSRKELLCIMALKKISFYPLKYSSYIMGFKRFIMHPGIEFNHHMNYSCIWKSFWIPEMIIWKNVLWHLNYCSGRVQSSKSGCFQFEAFFIYRPSSYSGLIFRSSSYLGHCLLCMKMLSFLFIRAWAMQRILCLSSGIQFLV